MAYVDKINVQGTDYDIHDKRIPDNNGALDFSSKDIVAKTLEQNEYNWETGEVSFNATWLNGVTAEGSFIKIAKVNRKLYVVISATLHNETGSDIVMPANQYLLEPINLPASISSKIYRKDGTPCSQSYQAAYSGDDVILPIQYGIADTDGSNPLTLLGNIFSSAANSFGLWVSTSVTIPANSRKVIDYRVSLLL